MLTWKSPIFSGNYIVFQPLFGRVYVNLVEGKFSIGKIKWDVEHITIVAVITDIMDNVMDDIAHNHHGLIYWTTWHFPCNMFGKTPYWNLVGMSQKPKKRMNFHVRAAQLPGYNMYLFFFKRWCHRKMMFLYLKDPNLTSLKCNPMTDPWCCYIWSHLPFIYPRFVSINIPAPAGSVMGMLESLELAKSFLKDGASPF